MGCGSREGWRLARPMPGYARFLFLVVGVVSVLTARSAAAGYFDDDRNVSLRATLYTETSIATESAEAQTGNAIRGGDVVSHRTFFNPELDADLTPLLSSLGLDEIKFRLALWGFYDGVYDYLPGKFDSARRNIKARFSRGRRGSAPFFPRHDSRMDFRKIYAYQPDPTLGGDGGVGEIADIPFRINEAYLNLTAGRLSVRVGRQAISWGESDTIALLDQSNPFDITRALPGIFEDIDEARIPLWTLRGQVGLFDVWGPLSGGFLDVYLVPGSIDTTTSEVPVPGGVSPYSPPEADPAAFVDSFTAFVPPDFEPLLDSELGGISFTQYDHDLPRSMANSRYGVRVESIVNQEYTASLWFYRSISQIPVPRFKRFDLSATRLVNPSLPPGSGPAQIINETVHGLTNVFGSSLSFYSRLLNGVVRLNAQYHLNEPAFIPSENLPFENLLRHPKLRKFLNALPDVKIPAGSFQGHVPHADFFRFEAGVDRFFFNRLLNPSNSFVWVTSLVGSWNVSETFTGEDYRSYGQRKIDSGGLRNGVNVGAISGLADVDKLRTVATDFVDLKEFEWFLQSSVQTDYFHGRLTPRVTIIINPRGTVVLNPGIVFRYADRMLFSLKYAYLGGGFFQTGLFRDRDQVTARMTLLMN